jgi:transcriptional regulator with XRE-family HTH domain
MSIGQRLELIRNEKGLTQRAMAEFLGTGLGTYANYIIDATGPKTEVLFKLLNDGYSLNWLVGGIGPMRVGHGPDEIYFDRKTVEKSASAVFEYLESRGQYLEPDDFGGLVRAIAQISIERQAGEGNTDPKAIIIEVSALVKTRDPPWRKWLSIFRKAKKPTN